MHDLLLLAIKAVAGGALVVAFTLLGEALSPKRFAGLFGAAPAVALAGLTILLLDKRAHEASAAATGMIAGSVGMIAYALLAFPLHTSRTPSAVDGDTEPVPQHRGELTVNGHRQKIPGRQ